MENQETFIPQSRKTHILLMDPAAPHLSKNLQSKCGASAGHSRNENLHIKAPIKGQQAIGTDGLKGH
jgi:hypothetical protein